MRHRWGGLTAWTLTALLATARPAQGADELTDSARATARALGYEGVAAYEAGLLDEAKEKLSRAFAMAKVPTLGLWLARTMVARGELVEASERYAEVTRLQPDMGQAEAQRRAQLEAEAERQALLPRLASLVIRVPPAVGSSAQLSLDGAEVPRPMWGVPIPVNPGRRVLTLRGPDAQATHAVDLVEGERREVLLNAEVPGSVLPGSVLPPREAPGPSTPPTGEPKPADGPPQTLAQTIGWTCIIAGGAALAGSAGLGTAAYVQKRDLDCPRDVCRPDQRSEVEEINALRTWSTFTALGGAVLGGAGLTLLLLTPQQGRPPTEATVTPQGLLVRGVF